MKQTIMHWAFPAFFVVAGILHFARPVFYAERLPSTIPLGARIAMVVATGIFEVLLGVLAARPRTRRLGATGVLVILTGAIGANVFALVTGRQPGDLPIVVQWLRVGFLVALASWAFITRQLAEARTSHARET